MAAEHNQYVHTQQRPDIFNQRQQRISTDALFGVARTYWGPLGKNASSWGCPHVAYEDITNIAVC